MNKQNDFFEIQSESNFTDNLPPHEICIYYEWIILWKGFSLIFYVLFQNFPLTDHIREKGER